MYYCQQSGCKNLTKPGEAQLRVTIQKRAQSYENMVNKPRCIRRKIRTASGQTKIVKKYIKNKSKKAKKIRKVTRGWEIKKEIAVCRPCAIKLGAIRPEQKFQTKKQYPQRPSPEDLWSGKYKESKSTKEICSSQKPFKKILPKKHKVTLQNR